MDFAETTRTQNEDENYSLLCQAHEQFNNNEYDRCLELLQQLESKGESSRPILRHNRAVVNYYKSGCTQHATLLQDLEELVLDVKPVTGSGSGSVASGSDGVSVGLSLKHGGGGSAATVARYNKAVIYYHRHMYATALEKLSPLVGRLEALEKSILALVATLQLQLLLATNQLNRAEAFLDHLQYKLNLVSSAPTIVTTTNTSSSSSSNNTSASNPEEATAAAPTVGSADPVVARVGNEGSKGTSLQLLQLLTHVLNRKPVLVTEDGSPEYAALKAQQYYIMKDFQMAAKQLMRINNECTQSSTITPHLSTCIANNMGVIHLRVRHYAIAAKFFQNALNFDKQLAFDLRQRTLQTMSSAHSCEILYNLGIAMLHLRRAKEAFQCFLVPIKQYHNNPRLWLRMAEACIMEHEVKVQEEERQFLPANEHNARKKQYAPQSAAVPELTLEFAALCLRNALTLTHHCKANFHVVVSSEDSPEQKSDLDQQSWRHLQDNNFCNPSKPISIESLENMLAAIYAAHSYVSLRLEDYVTALEMAQQMLHCERLSDAHKLLAHMYAAEALMQMHKPTEARDHLDPSFVGTLNAFDLETRDWQLKSLDAAQNVVRYNLAVVMAMQKDYPKAKTLLSTLSHAVVSPKALALRRHIDTYSAYPAPN
ncbi:CCR4-NOT transcription complex subunit 10 [Drosophila tropicalis]|uniref:CCR4-NOT transcription complex subunit 10 n=1 Tax=Drosophila tropicalis TaxID=46794 RepID=UPI0035AB748A